MRASSTEPAVRSGNAWARPLQRLRVGRVAAPERAVGVERVGGHRAARGVRPILERERGDEQRKERWQESGPVHAGIQHLRRG